LFTVNLAIITSSEVPAEAVPSDIPSKKQKMESADAYPVAPDSEWPEAWIMPIADEADETFDQCKLNRCEPNEPVTVQDLKSLGIEYWKMEDVDKYSYPVLAVPYDPKDAVDPKLMALRDSRGYSYADIITVHPDHLPNFEEKIKCFFEEVSFQSHFRLTLFVSRRVLISLVYVVSPTFCSIFMTRKKFVTCLVEVVFSMSVILKNDGFEFT
jgi:ARD/ARD' family